MNVERDRLLLCVSVSVERDMFNVSVTSTKSMFSDLKEI